MVTCFWARVYFVSMVGRDEEVVREYIRHQDQEDQSWNLLNRCGPTSGGQESRSDTLMLA